MIKLQENKLLKYHNDTLEAVRMEINLNKPGEMDKAVDILEDWVMAQNHFTKKKFDRKYLETTIVVSKGSIERAKARLDKACTLRTMMPELFGEFNLKKDFTEDLKDIHQAVLPEMTAGHNRVYFMRTTGDHFTQTMISSFSKYASVLSEYIRRNDYCISYYVVVDYRTVNLTELALRFTVNEIRHLSNLLLECHGFRVKGIHILSASKLIDTIVFLVKQVVSKKVGDRIQVHKDLDSLYEIVDKNILPEEYGGKEKPLKQLQDDWIEELMSKDHQDYINELFSARTDESLRQRDKFNDTYIGLPGTFRTLSVD